MADSLETNKKYEFDLELANDLSRDYDDVDREEDDAAGNHGGGGAGAKGAGHGSGSIGGNRDDHPMRRSSSVRSGSAIDARTLNILLQNDGPEEGRDEDKDRGGDPNGPRRYHNIRGGLTSLQDNLAGRANQLANLMKKPSCDSGDRANKDTGTADDIARATGDPRILVKSVPANRGDELTESKSMWTAVGSALGGYNRRSSEERSLNFAGSEKHMPFY